MDLAATFAAKTREIGAPPPASTRDAILRTLSNAMEVGAGGARGDAGGGKSGVKSGGGGSGGVRKPTDDAGATGPAAAAAAAAAATRVSRQVTTTASDLAIAMLLTGGIGGGGGTGGTGGTGGAGSTGSSSTSYAPPMSISPHIRLLSARLSTRDFPAEVIKSSVAFQPATRGGATGAAAVAAGVEGGMNAIVRVLRAPSFSDDTTTSAYKHIDLQLTQWSGAYNPFTRIPPTPSASSASSTSAAAATNTNTTIDFSDVSDVFTFTLRHNGTDVPSLHILKDPVVFAFPVTIDPRIVLEYEDKDKLAAATNMAEATGGGGGGKSGGKSGGNSGGNSGGKNGDGLFLATTGSCVARMATPHASYGGNRTFIVAKTSIASCAQWDTRGHGWKSASEGGACTLSAFDCVTRVATCRCLHLTDFATLISFNFNKLAAALTVTDGKGIDTKNLLLSVSYM